MVEKDKDKSETITFYIDGELKKDFQIKLIRENSSITVKLTELIRDYVNKK